MKRGHGKNISSVILALAAAASMPFASLATTYYVSTNGTFTLDSGSTTNATANRLDVSGSATLKLTGTATNGAFPLRLGIRFTTAAANAVLTVDATEVADCTSIRMTGDTRDNSGSATISLPSGMSEFVIGDAKRGAHDAKNMASFDINVMFGGEGCVVFTNDVTVARLPTCSWRIAPGARVATFGRLLFGDGDFALTDYDIELGNPASFANGASLAVPVGRALYVRPCRFNNSYDGTWIGESSVGASTSVYMTNNVVLGGVVRECERRRNSRAGIRP